MLKVNHKFLWPMLLIFLFVSACQSRQADTRYTVLYTPSTNGLSSERDRGNHYTIAVVPKREGIDYFNAARDGALEAARELGVNVIYKGPKAADSEDQIEVIEELIEQDVNLIAVSANDPDKLIPVLRKAERKGIKVITWDADTSNAGRQFFVNMVDPETLGRHLMDTLAWNTDEQGKFAIMAGAKTASNSNEWIHWIKMQKDEYYPGMKLVEIVATDDSVEQADRLAEQLLADHSDLAGIIGSASVGPPAAAKAVEKAGKQDQVKVVGLSTPNLMRTYLHNGSAQVATLWSPKRLGYLTVVLAANLLDGIEPYDGQEIYNVGNIRVKGDMVIMGEPLDFNKENVDQYDF